MQNLLWAKSLDNKWLNLQSLDPLPINAVGVYIIWHGGTAPRIIRIGEGHIGERLTAHKNNVQIMRYQEQGPVMVTWAEVEDPIMRGGIEAYLSRQYAPLIKSPPSPVLPIAARTPFA